MTDRERLENMSPIGFDLKGDVLLRNEDYHWLMEQAERVEELEKKVQRYEQKFEEILELGWTENFGGSYVNMGEYHADAIQIAESALGRSKRND